MDGEKKMQRYLVRKASGDVFAWNDILSKRKDLEEVYAESPNQALNKEGIPDHRNISLDQIESMQKDDLITFAKVRLGLTLDPSQKKLDLQDQVKLAIFQPREEAKEAFTPSAAELDRPRARAI